MTSDSSDPRAVALARRVLPFLAWKPYRSETLKADLLAGFTVALVLIPQSMAYAQLAGLPPYYGLYAAFLPVAVAALWGSSHQLGSGPVAVVSLLTASTLAPLAQAGSEGYVAMAIGLALAMEPGILLCDEITSALDPELVGEVLAVVESLAQEGMTLLMVTHEMNFARKVADRVVFMHAGRIHEMGPPQQLFGSPQTPELQQFLSALH